jgi:thiol-disulfide isomerase/thioredoxin
MKTIKNLVLVLGLLFAVSIGISAQTALTTLDGTKIDVQGHDGKVVILAMGASWLPLSAKQAEYTNILAKKYGGKNVVVYFVATDSATAKSKNFASSEDIRKFATTSKLTARVLRDPDGAATLKKFKVDQLPSFVILDKTGALASEPFGGIDPKYDITLPISKAVDKLL